MMQTKVLILVLLSIFTTLVVKDIYGSQLRGIRADEHNQQKPIDSTQDQNAIVPYNITKQTKTKTGQLFELQYTGDQEFYQKPSSPIPKNLTLTVIENSDLELTVIITDGNSFSVPENSQFFPSDKLGRDTGNRKYKYEVLQDADTIFKLERILDDGTTESIFDSTGAQFIYSALYSTIGTSLNNNFLYGFGERRKKFRYDKDGQYTTFPKDQFTQIDNGEPDHQTYGYHPMWLKKEESGNFHVGFLKSTSALQTEIVAGQKFKLHIVGGQIYLKFFLGDSQPENVIKAYHAYLNGYNIHPFWSQGYHQSRWGYNSSKMLLDVQQKFQDSGFPIDTIWNDLDYMQDYMDFTLQPNFKVEEMNQLTDTTKVIGLHWVPLIDMGVATGTDSADAGVKQGIFLNSSVYVNQTLVACVWPGPVYFPDFNHPASFDYWNQSLYLMYTKLGTKPSGYWLDMNENSNFIAGERSPTEPCPPADFPPTPKVEVDDSKWIPFPVAGLGSMLSSKTTTMSTMHYQGADALLIPNQNTTELFFHPLNAYGEQYISHESLKSSTKSPLTFILTRSSTYGSGKYAAHWTGDNFALWEFFGLAVSELLPFQLFGIPFVGQDLCGFAGDTTAELCTRWMQLGAWTPFSRNHNSNVSIAQEPFAFQEDYVLTATRNAFLQRYAFMKWMYSLFIRNWDRKQEFGRGTVMKPLWWLFSDDDQAFNFEDRQFMMGEEIMIAPVLIAGNSVSNSTFITIYFPGNANETWIDPSDNGHTYLGGTTKLYEVAFTQNIPYFLRGGYVVYKQQTYDKPALRARLLDNNFDLLVVMKLNSDNTYQANGQMLTLNSYEDQNVHDSCLSGYKDCIAQITLQGSIVGRQFQGTFRIAPSSYLTVVQEFYINQLVIYGVQFLKGLDNVYIVDIKSSVSSYYSGEFVIVL